MFFDNSNIRKRIVDKDRTGDTHYENRTRENDSRRAILDQ